MLPSVVIIKEEEDVLYILQEQLPELLGLNLAGAGADWTRGVIDYLVRRTENPDSSRALLTLSETKWGHLMELRSAELVRGNQYLDRILLHIAPKSYKKPYIKPSQDCNKVAQAPEKYRKSNRRISGTV